jgi:hypothetical protein
MRFGSRPAAAGRKLWREKPLHIYPSPSIRSRNLMEVVIL